jgi:hypothetical protein
VLHLKKLIGTIICNAVKLALDTAALLTIMLELVDELSS